MKWLKTALSAGLLVSLWTVPTFAADVEPRIAPHKALYSLSLLEAPLGDVGELNGAMIVDMSKSCETGWRLESILRMTTGQSDRPEMRLEVESLDIESLDGKTLNFSSTVTVNGQVSEQISGEASLQDDGGGRATFDKPLEGSQALPKGTFFPMAAFQESLRVIWQDGKKINTYLYFDGTAPEPMRVTDLVAGDPEPLSEDLIDPSGLTDGLTEQDAHRIVSTVFDMSRTDAEPQTTYIGDILPNGVVSRLTIDLGFMTIEARLAELTALEDPNCGA